MKYLLSIIIVLFLLNCKTSEKSEYIEYRGNIFGSTFLIQYESKQNLNSKIDSIFNQFNQAISTYQNDSEISKFNQSEKEFVSDSEDLINLIQFSKQIHYDTNGFYDPTVMPLSNLWGINKGKLEQIPTQIEIDSVLSFVGLNKISIQDSLIVKSNPNIELNFNSVTGYCNDMIANLFEQYKIENYLIEIGGEILVKGNNAKGNLWTVGIDDPLVAEKGKREITAKVQLDNKALATSGNYRKFIFDESGNKIVHTINPITGKASASNVLSATVISNSCAKADAIATAIMAMGYVDAEVFLNQNKDLSAYLIISNQDSVEVKMFNDFDTYLKNYTK